MSFARKKYLTKNEKETIKLGKNLAKEFLKIKKGKSGLIIALKGELGSGKTAFLKGFARGLGIKEKILSPTFVIMKRFKIRKKSGFGYFYHFDCYRLKNFKDLKILNFEKIISEPENIIAIEWPEKIKKSLLKKAVWIEFEIISGKKNSRKIIVDN